MGIVISLNVLPEPKGKIGPDAELRRRHTMRLQENRPQGRALPLRDAPALYHVHKHGFQ